MVNAVKLKELLTNINGRFDSIEFDSRASRVLMEQGYNKDMKPIAELAKTIAFDAHKGQTRRDGKTPYFEHLKAVVSRLPDDDITLAVGWLHDVLEDTDYTVEKLQKLGVPDYVVFPVIMLTKEKDASYEDYIEALRYTTISKQVKIADILSNLADTPTERQIVKYSKALLKLIEH